MHLHSFVLLTRNHLNKLVLYYIILYYSYSAIIMLEKNSKQFNILVRNHSGLLKSVNSVLIIFNFTYNMFIDITKYYWEFHGFDNIPRIYRKKSLMWMEE